MNMSQFMVCRRKVSAPQRPMGCKSLARLTFAACFLLLGACATSSWQITAGKFLSSTALTADATMKGWAAWVVAGQSKPDQEVKVRELYGQYQSAMALAQAAYGQAVAAGDQSLWNAKSRSLAAASGALTAAVQQFSQPQPKP